MFVIWRGMLVVPSGARSTLTFAVGSLNYPGAVEIVGVEVGEAGREDGPRVSLDVTSTQGCG